MGATTIEPSKTTSAILLVFIVSSFLKDPAEIEIKDAAEIAV
jgi:hypothetical protein